MRFGRGDHPIQTLAPKCADDSLADRIRFWASWRRSQHLDAKATHRFVEVRGEDAIAIVHQVLASRIGPDGLAQLLQCPCGRRMCGDVEVNQATAAVLDDHEYVEHPERGGDGDQKIAGNDSLGVQALEGGPTRTAPWPARWARGKVFPHGARRDLYSELQKKLIGDALLAPCGILVPHAADQILYLPWDTRSAGPRHQVPVQPPARPVPADHRLWAHHHPSIASLGKSREQCESDTGNWIDAPRLRAAFHI